MPPVPAVVTPEAPRSLSQPTAAVEPAAELPTFTEVPPGLPSDLLLRRPDIRAAEQQLIAANVDTLFVVTSCNDDFNPARLERYLALANEAGTDPVIVLTKIDKVDDPSDWIDRARTLQRGLQVVALNAKSPDAAAVLAPWCGPGRTVALVGSSGVGKSTLLNTLSGRDAQATGEIRESDAKGRHTTTARSLHPVAGGGWVIDTPGVRSFGLGHVDPANILRAFSDLAVVAEECPRGCTHLPSAPDCAIIEAVAEGRLGERGAARLDSLQRLLETFAG